MPLWWMIARLQVAIDWRSTLGHPTRRFRLRGVVALLVLYHLLLLLTLLAEPVVMTPGILTTAAVALMTSYALIDAPKRLLANTFILFRTAPVPWRTVSLGHLLSSWLQASGVALLVVSPLLMTGALTGFARLALGYLFIPVLALPTVLIAWVVASALVRRAGSDGALFLTRGLSYLLLAGIAFGAAQLPGYVERIGGWWAYTTLPLLGALVLALGSAPLVLWLGALLLAWQWAPSASVQGRANPVILGPARARFVSILVKELLLLWRHPQIRAGLLVFPAVLLFVAWVLFRQEPAALFAELLVFSPALLAMAIADTLGRYEERQIDLFLTSPTPMRLILLAKVLTALVPPVLLLVAGAILAHGELSVGATAVLVGAGVANGLFIAAYTVQARFQEFAKPSTWWTQLTGALAVLATGAVALGAYIWLL